MTKLTRTLYRRLLAGCIASIALLSLVASAFAISFFLSVRAQIKDRNRIREEQSKISESDHAEPSDS